MALQKPLVIIDGVVQQIPPGDTLDAQVSETNISAFTNGNAGAITKSQAVYATSTADTCDLAQANALATGRVVGIVKDASIPAAASGAIQTGGEIDGFSGMTPGANQYLDPTTPGALTETAPTVSGQVVTKVGRAKSATVLIIDPEEPILIN